MDDPASKQLLADNSSQHRGETSIQTRLPKPSIWGKGNRRGQLFTFKLKNLESFSNRQK